MSTDDSSQSGSPTEAMSEAAIEAVHSIVLKSRRSTIRYIAETLEMSYGSVQTIIFDNLGMSTLTARWVPRMLTADIQV